MQTVKLAHLRLQPGQWVLDLGCGQGRHAHAVAMLSNATVVALDINMDDVKHGRDALAAVATPEAQQRACWAVADGQQLPFSDASFDAVICSEVLEHIPEYQNFLTEAQRVLKTDGLFAVSVPRAWPERICWRLCSAYHQVEGGHVRIFNATQLKRSINRHTFAFIRQHFAHGLHTPYWWLRCLFWQRGEQFTPVRVYHRFLVWDLMSKPKLTRALEALLNPCIGKSVVMYFHKKSDAQSPHAQGPEAPC